MRQTNQRGSATAFVAVVATSLLLVAGMAYDGGQVITAHSSARHTAQRAARIGAQQIDLDHLRSTGEIVLSSSSAERAAHDFLRLVGARGTVSVSGSSITVTVTAVQPMHIIPSADRTIVVSATATAVDHGQP